MKQDELFYLLALQAIDGIGAINARKMIKHYGSAQRIFEATKEDLQSVSGIRPIQVEQILNKASLEAAEVQLKFILQQKIGVLDLGNSGYPKLLKHCSDAPLLLFARGELELNSPRVISIVGTRSMTNYGRNFIDSFIEDLVPFNPLIISGLAYGVDIHVHQKAVQHGLQTVAILAHGLDRIYPDLHSSVARKMLDNGGLLTEYWSGTKPDRENFVKRNRIIAGMSSATIVIESAFKGGSLITAEYAASYYRDVFAVPGRTSYRYSVGCNHLIKTHKAAAITSVKDLEYQLNWTPQRKAQVQRTMFLNLTNNEKQLMDLLDNHGTMRLENLHKRSDLGIGQVSAILLQLELKGAVRALPGKLFEKV